MPALEPVEAWRVVASPTAIDAARWRGQDVDVLRIAPDEALGIGATGVGVDDPGAIIEPEAGFSAAILAAVDLDTVLDHVEWRMPDETGALVQGKVAGVPVKLVAGDPILLVVATAYTDELERRLGWR